MNTRQTNVQVWVMPIIIGLLSTIGLIAALLADGYADILSWLSLSIPVYVILWFWLRKKD